MELSKLLRKVYPLADRDYPDTSLKSPKKTNLRFVKFGNNVLIGKKVKIGKNTLIGSNTIIESNVQIGSDCVIGSEL